jgi:hypothetical protein
VWAGLVAVGEENPGCDPGALADDWADRELRALREAVRAVMRDVLCWRVPRVSYVITAILLDGDGSFARSRNRV